MLEMNGKKVKEETYLAGFLTEGETVCEISSLDGRTYFVIMKDDSTDLGGAMEETLTRLLDRGVDNDTIRIVCGYVLEELKDKDEDDMDTICIDRGYVLESAPVSVAPTEYSYIKTAVYGAYLSELIKEDDPCAAYALLQGCDKNPELRAESFDTFLGGTYLDTYFVEKVLGSSPERTYQLYLEDVCPGNVSYKEAGEMVDAMLREKELTAVMANMELYIYNAYSDMFVPKSGFVQFIHDHPEYRKFLCAGSCAVKGEKK